MKRLAALLALALFSLACAPKEGGDDAAPAKAQRSDRGNKLVIGIQQEPDKLNTMLNAMVYGTYIFATAAINPWEKMATGAIAIGMLMLLASVIWERLREWDTDPYKDVHR